MQDNYPDGNQKEYYQTGSSIVSCDGDYFQLFKLLFHAEYIETDNDRTGRNNVGSDRK